MTSTDGRERILKACHSEPTSGHFELTKMWKRITERLYLKGIDSDVRKLYRLKEVNGNKVRNSWLPALPIDSS